MKKWVIIFLLLVSFIFFGCEQTNSLLNLENDSLTLLNDVSEPSRASLIEDCKSAYADFGQSILDICYIKHAMEYGDPLLCDEVLEESEEEIITCKAIASRDKYMCLELDLGSEVQNRCYSNLARILNDSTYCDYIDERFCPSLRNICISQFK